jgi:Cof subfamily protein (haloacid dehalogenase superfamily)
MYKQVKVMSNEIKLIATDLDGTLLNSKHELTPYTEQVLRKVMDRGVHVVLATGKSRNSAIKLIERLGLTTPGVYLQGLAVYGGDGTITHQQTLDEHILRRVIDFAEEHDQTLIAYSGLRILCRNENEFTSRLQLVHEPLPELISPFSGILGSVPINKMYFTCRREDMPALREKLKTLINGTATVVQSTHEIVEILPLGMSKGAGLKLLIEDMNVAPENVMALGDGDNDIEMIQLAGIGVAMANAMPRVKEVADYITASNDEDGVAQAIERYVLDG